MGYLLSVLGSSIDEFYKAEIYPKEGDFSFAHPMGRKAGGPPLNVSCVCASKGGEVKVLDYLSDNDESSSFLVKEMEGYGVDASHIIYGEALNGRVVIINTAGERTMFVVNPKRPYYTVDEKMQELLNGSSYVYSLMHIIGHSFEDVSPLHEARKHGARILFDGTSKYEGTYERDLLYDLADGVFINETGYENLSRVSEDDPKKILFERGASFICVTSGSKGARCYTKDREYFQPAFKTEVLDSTGAGDSFAGAFIYGLLKGYDYDKCLKLACLNGAYACRVFGGQGGCCSYDELCKFAEDYGIRREEL